MVHLLLIIIYISFISLGLPDALLGSAWPTMYTEFQVPLSYAGIISMIIAAGTIISSLNSDRLTRKLGTALVTALSVGLTALAIFGFSISNHFILLCLMAIPYGLGAGSVDASLNNYVALHYDSKVMSWLHCMWGVGVSVGPYVISYALTQGMSWNAGYRYVFFFQAILTVILFFSLPAWKKRSEAPSAKTENPAVDEQDHPLSLAEIIKIPGAKEVMLTFFCYCAVESTAILWGASYLVLGGSISKEIASSFAAFFCIGLTVGRGISGFMTMRFNDTQMIRMGLCLIGIGILFLLLPPGMPTIIIGFICIGLGCAPIYPCIIHSTPYRFGAHRSQAIIGVQMASAYTGTLLMPFLFGILANHIHIRLFPFYLGGLFVLMLFSHERLIKATL